MWLSSQARGTIHSAPLQGAVEAVEERVDRKPLASEDAIWLEREWTPGPCAVLYEMYTNCMSTSIITIYIGL